MWWCSRWSSSKKLYSIPLPFKPMASRLFWFRVAATVIVTLEQRSRINYLPFSSSLLSLSLFLSFTSASITPSPLCHSFYLSLCSRPVGRRRVPGHYRHHAKPSGSLRMQSQQWCQVWCQIRQRGCQLWVNGTPQRSPCSKLDAHQCSRHVPYQLSPQKHTNVKITVKGRDTLDLVWQTVMARTHVFWSALHSPGDESR